MFILMRLFAELRFQLTQIKVKVTEAILCEYIVCFISVELLKGNSKCHAEMFPALICSAVFRVWAG